MFRIRSDEAEPEATALWKDKNFRMFVYAVAGAYSGILIRCIYRYGIPRCLDARDKCSVADGYHSSAQGLLRWPVAGETTSCRTSRRLSC